MDKGYEAIETVLTSLKTATRSINREIENLVNTGIVDEEDTAALTRATSELYKTSKFVEELILLILTDEWNAKQTREAIVKQRLLLVLQREALNEERHVMDTLGEKLEEKIRLSLSPSSS